MSDERGAAAAPAEEVEAFPLSKRQVGMLGLIASESAFFATFAVTYLFYVGRSRTGPLPDPVLDVPWLITACLLSSSATIGLALRALRQGRRRAFGAWWALTFALGAAFLAGTAREWHRLIFDEGLTIRTNLFGTTFYSLVGFHAAHVAAGLGLLATVGTVAWRGRLDATHAERVEPIVWYWHFVDAVWVVVFTTVYGLGR